MGVKQVLQRLLLIAGTALLAPAMAEDGGQQSSAEELAKEQREPPSVLEQAIAGEHRSAKDKARDRFRKPRQTLEFLGFRPDMTVVEIWPGSGWYTQILAAALKDEGKLYCAQFNSNGAYGFQRRANAKLLTLLGRKPDIYRGVTLTTLDFPYHLEIAPRGSADMVLTFRNIHNWVMKLFGGGVYAHLGFQAMYDVLKPGGILGIVDHRWPDPETEDPVSQNGYISIERTVALAEAAGFKLVDQSEILANPLDTRDYPEGVWTLPPTYALVDTNKEKYAEIGESDRFLLKFVKPVD